MEFKSPIQRRKSGEVSRPADPFTGFRQEMDRLFEDFTRGWGLPGFAASSGSASGLMSPNVNVAESDAGLEITADLPGVEQDDIDLDLADGVLTLKAEHKTEKEEKDEKDEKKHYHLIERSYGTYMRRFALPFEADEDKIEAKFEKGVLTVTIPRSKEAEKAVKKISVASG